LLFGLFSHSALFIISQILLGFFDPLIVYRHCRRFSLAIVHAAGCDHAGPVEAIENDKYNISTGYPILNKTEIKFRGHDTGNFHHPSSDVNPELLNSKPMNGYIK